MGGVDGYSCSAKAPKKACTDFLNYLATTDVQKAYYKAFNAPPVNKDAQAVVTEPYLKVVIDAFNNGAVRLAVARHPVRPERRRRAQHRGGEPARRPGLGRRHHQRREQRIGQGIVTTT